MKVATQTGRRAITGQMFGRQGQTRTTAPTSSRIATGVATLSGSAAERLSVLRAPAARGCHRKVSETSSRGETTIGPGLNGVALARIGPAIVAEMDGDETFKQLRKDMTISRNIAVSADCIKIPKRKKKRKSQNKEGSPQDYATVR